MVKETNVNPELFFGEELVDYVWVLCFVNVLLMYLSYTHYRIPQTFPTRAGQIAISYIYRI